jgi:predicted metal-dependent hydrolase
MTDPAKTSPPRLVPERPLPPYAYQPGLTPHPTRDPEGHGYGEKPEPPAAPDPEGWRACGDYLYGIDLFNSGYFWEAHEAWEGLWVACGRRGATATFLQALINLAAAGFKARWGNARGMRANARTARELFEAAARYPGGRAPRTMGLEVRALADYAERIARSPGTSETTADGDRTVFDMVLRPE